MFQTTNQFYNWVITVITMMTISPPKMIILTPGRWTDRIRGWSPEKNPIEWSRNGKTLLSWIDYGLNKWKISESHRILWIEWIMDSKMNSSLMDICWRNRCKYILYINVYILYYVKPGFLFTAGMLIHGWQYIADLFGICKL